MLRLYPSKALSKAFSDSIPSILRIGWSNLKLSLKCNSVLPGIGFQVKRLRQGLIGNLTFSYCANSSLKIIPLVFVLFTGRS